MRKGTPVQEGTGRHMSTNAKVVVGTRLDKAVRHDAVVVIPVQSTTGVVTDCAIRVAKGAR